MGATAPARPSTSHALRETGFRQRRWMSAPGSRVVVNPFAFTSNRTPLEHSGGAHLPLNVGYYVGARAHERGNLLGVYRRLSGTGRVRTEWSDPFTARESPRLDSAWRVGAHVSAEVGPAGRLRAELDHGAGDFWGELARPLEIDPVSTPYLGIGVASAADAWGLRLRVPGRGEVVVAADTTRTGEFTFELAPLIGTAPVNVECVLRVAAWQRPAEFSRLCLLAVDRVLVGADRVATSWTPHELAVLASYPGARLTGSDILADDDTVLRSVTVTSAADREWSIGGSYTGTPHFDRRARTLVVEDDDFSYAIAVAAAAGGEVGYAADEPALIAGELVSEPPLRRGYWSLPVRLTGRTTPLAAVAFATAFDGGGGLARRRARTALRCDPAARQRRRRRGWDAFLRRVPHPTCFDVQSVERHGVTADDVRHTYYAAWSFLRANVLPPMPEAGFGYPQHACGKPSLYADGPPPAASVAAWESLFAIQLWAYVDPEDAWAAMRGLMTLVDAGGVLGGEALPARKAQTAAVLCGVTGDLNALAEIYPALRRHLLWAADNPRWILRDLTPPEQKDAQFVASVLIDMGFARDLATALGRPDDARMWEGRRAELFTDYRSWFWEKPDAPPCLYHRPDTGDRDSGNVLWIAPGLHVDLWSRGAEELAGLVRRFDDGLDPSAFFAGFGQPKYPDISYAAAGLLDVGRPSDARALLNAALRDVCRSHQFAEEYVAANPPGSGQPDGSGVRPSVFGAAMVIDAVWQNNGYRMDLGAPAVVRLGANAAGIRGLRVGGGLLDIERPARSATMTLRGPAVRAGGAVTLRIGETRQLGPGAGAVA